MTNNKILALAKYLFSTGNMLPLEFRALSEMVGEERKALEAAFSERAEEVNFNETVAYELGLEAARNTTSIQFCPYPNTRRNLVIAWADGFEVGSLFVQHGL